MFALYGKPADSTIGLDAASVTNVTQRIISHFLVQENDKFLVRIAKGTSYNKIFGDPAFGVVKQLLIFDGNLLHVNTEDTEVDVTLSIRSRDDLEADAIRKHYWNVLGKNLAGVENRRQFLHKFIHFYPPGELNDELVEQKQSIEFLTGQEKILELGGNYGRNSVIIASILENDANLVVVEPGPAEHNILETNRKLNNMKFHTIRGALSYRPIIKRPDRWVSEISEEGSELKPGYEQIPTVTFEGITEKYGIVFDTLVLDCEGAFYWILKDNPKIMDNIKKVFIENDFREGAAQKEYVHSVFTSLGFQSIHGHDLIDSPFWEEKHIVNFWQVWRR